MGHYERRICLAWREQIEADNPGAKLPSSRSLAESEDTRQSVAAAGLQPVPAYVS